VVRKVRGVVFVHCGMVNVKYKGCAESLNALVFKPGFKVALVELGEVRDKVMEFIRSD